MADPDRALLGDVERYYSKRVTEFGATAKGVDWNSPESQALRFEQIAKLWGDKPHTLSIIDYGCGYGALVDFLRSRGAPIQYQGFDISTAMIAQAASRAGPDCTFTTRADALTPADFVVASGIFNVKLAHELDAWAGHVRRTLASMKGLSKRGFAFNALTSYADEEKQRKDLYYADPGYWFDHCKRAHSPRVTLLHDYPLYEFTILVRF